MRPRLFPFQDFSLSTKKLRLTPLLQYIFSRKEQQEVL